MRKPARFKTISNALAALLLLVGCWQLAGPIAVVTDPMLIGSAVQCTPDCRVQRDPVRLLTDDHWKMAWQMPDIEARIAERLEQPGVRALLVASSLLRRLPLFFLFVFLAVAARGFAVRGVSAREVGWLKWAARTAILWTLVQPVADTLQRRAMNAVARGREEFSILLDPERILTGLLIAAVALVAIRIIEAALLLRDDLEDYV